MDHTSTCQAKRNKKKASIKEMSTQSPQLFPGMSIPITSQCREKRCPPHHLTMPRKGMPSHHSIKMGWSTKKFPIVPDKEMHADMDFTSL